MSSYTSVRMCFQILFSETVDKLFTGGFTLSENKSCIHNYAFVLKFYALSNHTMMRWMPLYVCLTFKMDLKAPEVECRK